MNIKMSIERIADRLDTLAEITPDTTKSVLERIADSLDSMVDATPDTGKHSIERIADALEKYSGGGGGSSDFSTAEVTVITGSSEVEYLMLIPIINTESNCSDAIVRFGGQANEHLIVPLYKGKAFANVNGQYSVTVTGDAVFDDEEYIITITGNCTISLS